MFTPAIAWTFPYGILRCYRDFTPTIPGASGQSGNDVPQARKDITAGSRDLPATNIDINIDINVNIF